MIARSLVVAGVLAWSAGCIVPRAAGYGITAVPIPTGGADVGLALGGIYQQESSTTQAGAGVSGLARGRARPGAGRRCPGDGQPRAG